MAFPPTINTSPNNPTRRIERLRTQSTRIGTTQIMPFEDAEYFMELTASKWNGIAALQLSGLTGAIIGLSGAAVGAATGAIAGFGFGGAVGQAATNALNNFVSDRAQKTIQNVYALPICSSLVDTQSVQWETISLLGETASAIKGVALGTINDMAGTIGQGGVSDGAKGLSVATGLSPNEFLTVLFKGPSFKEYTLIWTFSPNDIAAARTLTKVLRELNSYVAPSLNGTGGSFLWKYPSMFDIVFRKRSLTNEGFSSPYLYKFKTCVCKGISANYAGSGMPAFYTGGYPETVILTMAFQEIEMWKSEDFDENWPQN